MANFPSRVCSSFFCAEVYLSFTILNAGISMCSVKYTWEMYVISMWCPCGRAWALAPAWKSDLSSKDEGEHLRRLDEAMTGLDTYGIKANLFKSVTSWWVLSHIYRGHRTDAEGIHPAQDKIEAILNAKTPEDVNELRTFIGIVTYYCKFIPNVSQDICTLLFIITSRFFCFMDLFSYFHWCFPWEY